MYVKHDVSRFRYICIKYTPCRAYIYIFAVTCIYLYMFCYNVIFHREVNSNKTGLKIFLELDTTITYTSLRLLIPWPVELITKICFPYLSYIR